MVTVVCLVAQELGLHWCDYTSETSDDIKNQELSDPARHWVDVALVDFTQTLSVGVDPQAIEFAACFEYLSSYGCSVRCSYQGVLRFGRDSDYPIQCTTVFICIKGHPLAGAALARHEERMEGTSYFQRALAILREERHELQLDEHRLEHAVARVGRRGGNTDFGRTCSALAASGGVQSTYVMPEDEELAIAAKVADLKR